RWGRLIITSQPASTTWGNSTSRRAATSRPGLLCCAPWLSEIRCRDSTTPMLQTVFTILAILQLLKENTTRQMNSIDVHSLCANRSWGRSIPMWARLCMSGRDSTTLKAGTKKPNRFSGARLPSVNRFWEQSIPPWLLHWKHMLICCARQAGKMRRKHLWNVQGRAWRETDKGSFLEIYKALLATQRSLAPARGATTLYRGSSSVVAGLAP